MSQRRPPITRLLPLLRHPYGWIATGFGAGLSPIAPGTAGSLVALLPYLLLRPLGALAVLAAAVVVFAIGVVAAQWSIDQLGAEDPGAVVIDEWVGQWLAFLPVFLVWPGFGFHPPLALELLAGFLLFRLFDIAKPWPANWADRNLHGGFGAMLDDAIAGCYAALAMAVLPLIAALVGEF
ncbi:MAG: phosphatidylglycerophosphatase A [Lysobacterales bacterium]